MRTRLCFWLLLITPFLVYGPAVFENYGLRDDYSHIREAHEEPGKIVKFNTSQGRPLYGALLETTFSHIHTVDDLMWMRLASVALLVALGVALWRQFDASGWPEVDAALAALAIVLLPAAQIVAAWAIAWPWGVSLLLAVAGFAAVETELEHGGLKRWLGVLGGIIIYMLATLIYQSNALFAVVPMAAAALPRALRRTPTQLVRWLALHLAVLFVSLLLCYLLLKGLFADGTFRESPRMALEHNPFTKLFWFLWQPLPNALGLYAFRDDNNALWATLFFWLTVIGVVGFLTWIIRIEPKKEGGVDRFKWWLCIGTLPWVAHGVSLIAAERSTGYRTLYALSALVVVAVFTGLRRLPLEKKTEPWVRYGIIGLILVLGAWRAWSQTSHLIAVPQSREWTLVHDAVDKTRFKDKAATRFYLIPATLGDRSTTLVHRDEFGSISADSGWTAKEMFKAAIRERFPNGFPKGQSYEYAQGNEAPAEGYDVLIDMRKLKQWRQ